jgi:hypothetical protein
MISCGVFGPWPHLETSAALGVLGQMRLGSSRTCLHKKSRRKISLRSGGST